VIWPNCPYHETPCDWRVVCIIARSPSLLLRQLTLALEMLARMLVTKAGSPLREALLRERALGKDLAANVDDIIRQVGARSRGLQYAVLVERRSQSGS